MRSGKWVLGWLLICPPLGAAPDRSMSMPNTFSNQTTSDATEVNANFNEAVTKYNAHDHTDISSFTTNTFTIGDGASGSKTYAINNQFTTAPAIRYRDTTEQWEVLPDGTSVSLAAQLTQLTIGDGSASNITLAVDNSFSTNPAIRYNVTLERWEALSDGTTVILAAVPRQLTVGDGSGNNIAIAADTSFSTEPAIRYNLALERWEASNNASTFSPIANDIRTAIVPIVGPTVATTTGDGKFYFQVPQSLNGMNLIAVHAQVVTAGTTGLTNVDVARCVAVVTGNACSGTVADMLSTNLTVDSGEDSSDTAATPAVIDTSNDDVTTNQVIRIDVDAVHTTPSQGLIVSLDFQLP